MIEALIAGVLPVALQRIRSMDSDELALAMAESLKKPPFTAEDRAKLLEVVRAFVALHD